MRTLSRLKAGLAAVALPVVMMAAGACGAAEEPAPTPTRAPAAVATPTPAPTTTPTPAGEQPKYGGIAVLAHRVDPPSWDNMVNPDLYLTLIGGALWGPGNLVTPCREDVFQVCPYLAESWESNADFTAWTFKVRDDVLWHDGTPFTAKDVKWWLDLSVNGSPPARKPAVYAPRMGPIEKVDVVEGNKVRIILRDPVGVFPALFTDRSVRITHPPHLMQPEINKGNATVSPHEVGYVSTGPFKMLKYDKGSNVQVRKFDKYWEKDQRGRQLPFMNGVDYPIIPEGAAGLAAFRSGRIDRTAVGLGSYLIPEQRATLKQEMGDKANIVLFPAYGKAIGMNARKAPYNDVRVRQALSLWIDRQSYINGVDSGDGELLAVFAPKSPYTNPDFREWPGWNPKTREQDRVRAKQLLAEAGYPSGFKVNVVAATFGVRQGEWLVGDLAGLLGAANLKLEVLDIATYNNRICAGGFDLLQPISSGVVNRHLPELVAAGYSSTNKCAYFQHDDKKVDELFGRIAATGDPATRVKLARELEKYLSIEQWLAINVSAERQYVAFRDYVKGWPVPAWNPENNADYATTWLDK
ncbi:MAG: ABC transporter substrate-binding protein [Chloroflexi bacterium]|nr:ABC transporter substrate-binding protein [Chloroflexota bacterium]